MKKNLLPIIFMLSFNLAGISQINLEDGLIAFFPFNGNAMDESTNSNDAINVNFPQLIEGHDGTLSAAYQFDGEDDYIEFPNNEGINLNGSETFAFSLWLKAPVNQVETNGTSNDILAKWNNAGTTPYPYGLRIFNQTHPNNGGKLVFVKYEGSGGSCNNAYSILGEKVINDDEWHHVVFQKLANNRIELYVDAQWEGDMEDASSCDFSNNNNLILGLRSLNVPNIMRPYSGGIDNLRIYNRPLNQDEINKIFSKDLTSRSEITENTTVKIYPNPLTSNTVKIELNNKLKIEKIELVNSLGQVIQEVNNGTIKHVPNGTYFIKIQLEDKQVVIEKINILNNTTR